MRSKKIRYYNNYDTDFEGGSREPMTVGEDYVYIRRGRGARILDFILYRLLATPIAFIYTKLILRERIIGREVLKGKRGFLLYALHNEVVGDAFTPSVAVFPRKCCTVVHPDNVSMPVLGRLNRHLGAIPTPSGVRAARSFADSIGERLADGCAVCIYPEGHVWQGCKDVRPFDSTSFSLAVKHNYPAYTLTRTYRKKKHGYRVITYIDGPFEPDMSLFPRDAREKLKDEVTNMMKERALLSDAEPIKYIKE